MNFLKASEDDDLKQWLKALTGDSELVDLSVYRAALEGLDWIGAHRDYAANLVREAYWLPHIPAEHRHFYPGGLSQAGFLGWGERLEDVLQADADALELLRVESRRIGQVLRELLDCYVAAATATSDELTLHLSVEQQQERIQQHLIASGIADHQIVGRFERGCQHCPFAGCIYGRKFAPHSNLKFEITHLCSGEVLRSAGLIWHLISEHGFFEGRESPHRIEPSQAVKVLQLH